MIYLKVNVAQVPCLRKILSLGTRDRKGGSDRRGGSGAKMVAQILPSTRAGGQDDGSLNKLPQMKKKHNPDFKVDLEIYKRIP